MKKKILCTLLISAITFSITGCSPTQEQSVISSVKNQVETPENQIESTKSQSETTVDSISTSSDEDTSSNVIKNDNNSNIIKNDGDSNVITNEEPIEEVKAPTVLDYGYVVVGHDKYYIEYAYEMKNENDFDIEFPRVKITAKDENGTILATSDDVRGYLAAGDTIAQSSQISCESMPASIEITGVKPDDYDIIKNSPGTSSKDFEISNVSLQGDSITGEITNISDNDYEDGYVVTAIFRDAEGKIISGATSYEYSSGIAGGESSVFEINCMFDPADYSYDTITVTAYGE